MTYLAKVSTIGSRSAPVVVVFLFLIPKILPKGGCFVHRLGGCFVYGGRYVHGGCFVDSGLIWCSVSVSVDVLRGCYEAHTFVLRDEDHATQSSYLVISKPCVAAAAEYSIDARHYLGT